MSILNFFNSSKCQKNYISIGVSPKQIVRFLYENKSYIAIDFKNCDYPSDEIFCNCKIEHNQMIFFVESLKYLQTFGVNVPKIYEGDLINKIFIMNDLGNNRLQDVWRKSLNDEYCKYYRKCIHIIYKIQELPKSELNEILNRVYEDNAIKKELYLFLNNVIKKSEIDEPIASEDELRKIMIFLNNVADLINSQTKSIIHRDFQSTNVLCKDDEIYLVDFQDMCIGPYLHDLVSVLYDQNVDLKNGFREELIDLYIKISGKSNCENLRKEIYINAIQRILKAMIWRGKKYFNTGDIKAKTHIMRGKESLKYLAKKIPEYEIDLNLLIKSIDV